MSILSKEELDSIFDDMDLNAAIFAFSKGCPYHVENNKCPNDHLKKIRHMPLRERARYIKEMQAEEKKMILYVHIKCVHDHQYVLHKKSNDGFGLEDDKY